MSVVLVAPNALQALKFFGWKPHRRTREVIRESRKRLVEKGMLKFERGFLKLTSSGEAELRRLEIADFSLKKPKRWDKKWRILIFDIPEFRKMTREKVRNTLRTIGFHRLQDSVWIYPYDCEDLITLLKADFKIGKDLLYIIADNIEYDLPLRKRFGLPK